MLCHAELGSASTGLEQFSAAAAQANSKLIAPRPTLLTTVDIRMRMTTSWFHHPAEPQRCDRQMKIPVLCNGCQFAS
jgi:hypothetical protein